MGDGDGGALLELLTQELANQLTGSIRVIRIIQVIRVIRVIRIIQVIRVIRVIRIIN
jgi:hypothetical protein